jgi:hypothetical protein
MRPGRSGAPRRAGSASVRDLAALVTIIEHDIPDRMLPDVVARDDNRRGPYL